MHAVLVVVVMGAQVFFVVRLTQKLVGMVVLFVKRVVTHVLEGLVAKRMFLVRHLGCLNLSHK